MNLISFTILGIPQPYKAPHTGKTKSGHMIHYDPIEEKKQVIAWEMRKAAHVYTTVGNGLRQWFFPLDDKPLRVTYRFYFPIPKAQAKKIKSGEHYTKRPDTDNLQKCYNDCLQLAGIISDDKFIVSTCAIKYYGELPRTEVDILILEKDGEKDEIL